MARFLEIKAINPKLKQSEVAKELVFSSSFFKRSRNDKNMLPFYRTPSNTNKRKRKVSKTEQEHKRSQMSSNDPLVKSVTEAVEAIKSVKTENKLKDGGEFEVNDKYLDEILHSNKL